MLFLKKNFENSINMGRVKGIEYLLGGKGKWNFSRQEDFHSIL